MSRRHWRSIEELEGAPAFLEARAREFPEGAADPVDAVSRREMLKLLGASLSLAGFSACRRPVERIVPFVNAPEEMVPGIPRRYATTMPFGRSAWGLLVESHEGRPTKIEGNPLHPATLGKSSARAQAAILDLYDPDRAQRVLKSGEPSTWEAFVAAWREIEAAHLATGGAGLAILTGSFASPTLARLRSTLSARFPNARFAVWEAAGDEAALRGTAAATGRDLEIALDLDRADVILSLDADLLLSDPGAIRHAASFAAGRRPDASDRAPDRAMNRLWVVEAVHSATGASADHRLPLRQSAIPAFVAALAARLAANGVPVPGAGAASEIPGVDPRWLDALAKDLAGARGRAAIAAGPRLPAEVHAAVLALNAALGNLGGPVRLVEPTDAALPDGRAVAELSGAMRAGEISTLVLLGVNPLYDGAAEHGFEEGLAKVGTTIALSDRADETGSRATWLLPRAHFLESWGDARDLASGTRSVIQPLILPLYGAKSDVELLGLLATGEDRPGYDLVRETWGTILGPGALETRWEEILHDGLRAEETAPHVPAEILGNPVADLAASRRIDSKGLDAVFVPSPALHDGRFAHNGWLLELADPVTRVTWGNPALVGPETARSLGVGNEDVVRVLRDGRAIELPVWVVPGTAEGTIVLTLGYGRTAAGRAGNGVGTNVYPLRPGSAGFTPGTEVVPTGTKAKIAAIQDLHVIDDLGRRETEARSHSLVREGTLAEYREHPDFATAHHHDPPGSALFEERSYAAKHQWGMTIDLNSCVGCSACVVACQAENNIPVVGADQVRRGRIMQWIRVDRYFSGEPAAPAAAFQPVPCMHCENAPCEQVCPVAATVHDEEGLNVMVYNRCIGTRYCSNNCPYKVRRFNFYNFTKDTPEILKLAQNPDVTVRARGVMEKCTFCVQRLSRAKIEARIAGREIEDGEIQTACQEACPASAIRFGDLSDPESAVSRAKRDPRNYGILEDLRTKPRTTYLARVRNPHPDLASRATEGHA